MRFLLPFLLLLQLTIQSKNLDIQECLDLIDFKPETYASGDFSFEGLIPLVDLKNGYYEIVSPYNGVTYIQAAKFNNSDGSITLMITGYEYDMVCERYHTKSYLILPEKEEFVEMSLHDLNLELGLQGFQNNHDLFSTLDKLYQQFIALGNNDEVSFESFCSDIYDFHYVLPRNGTAITVTLTICDYYPSENLEVTEEEMKLIQSGIVSRSYQYDKKFIRFK